MLDTGYGIQDLSQLGMYQYSFLLFPTSSVTYKKNMGQKQKIAVYSMCVDPHDLLTHFDGVPSLHDKSIPMYDQ